MLNRGALADPAHTLPQDIWDPSLSSYLIAWVGHALLHRPGAPVAPQRVLPAPYGLAYTDSLLGYAPVALIGTGPEAAVLRYNILFILAQALVLFGGYALARQLGSAGSGAAVAGVAIAMAPWRLAQAGHLHVLSTGGIAAGAGHARARPRSSGWRARATRAGARVDARRAARVGLAGWLVAAWQLTLGFGIGLVFLYVAARAVLVGGVVVLGVPAPRRCPPRQLARRRRRRRRCLFARGRGAAGPAVPEGARALPVRPPRRRLGRALLAARCAALLTAPAESLHLGRPARDARAQLPVPAEMALLPGFALYALAAAGLFFSVLAVWVRVALLAGAVAVSVVLGLGTKGPAAARSATWCCSTTCPGSRACARPGG